MKNHKYCVYITIYKGTKLPSFYIGSTSIEKVQNGYNGSIESKKYGKIYKEEQKENKHLFETLILRSCQNRKFALKAENYIQKQYNVVKSDLFMNLSFARVNGFHGMDTSGENNPNYGKHHTERTLLKLRKPKSEYTKRKMSESRMGYKSPNKGKTNIEIYGIEKASKIKKASVLAHAGKIHSKESNLLRSKATKNIPKEKVVCPHCGLEGGIPAMTRWHLNGRCKN